MVSVKSIVGVLCFVFLIILGFQTFADLLRENNPQSMLIFTGAAIILILLGTYLIKMGEKEDEAKRARKRRDLLLRDKERIRKLK
jgi:arginine exporter protein ArgO